MGLGCISITICLFLLVLDSFYEIYHDLNGIYDGMSSTVKYQDWVLDKAGNRDYREDIVLGK